MKTPRQLLVEQKNKGYDDYWNFLFRRLLFEMLFEKDLDLFKDMDLELDENFSEKFSNNVDRLLKDEPLGHVLGYEWFYGLKIKVNQDVLIPRGETEELVAHVSADIDDYFGNEEIVLADIACGSGAIAIASKIDHPNAIVHASDVSEKAIAVAKQNAIDNKADITFYVGDMATPLIEANIKVDVCICNPPYIKNEEDIEDSVKNYEPHVALFGGKDGLDLYRKLLDQLPLLLKPKAIVAFEIGFDQKDAILHEIKQRFANVSVLSKQDIHQKDRMIFVYFNITP
jgi:release factor glutamine methyltransferase